MLLTYLSYFLRRKPPQIAAYSFMAGFFSLVTHQLFTTRTAGPNRHFSF